MTDQLDTKAIQEAITEHWGPRCSTKDTDHFPELLTNGWDRCGCCVAWEQFDALCDALDKMKADNDRLRSALGRIRPIPERILQRIPVRDLAETLAEVDATLTQKGT